MRPQLAEDDLRAKQLPRILDSATYLAHHMHEAPALIIPCIEGRVENAGVVAQASVYGSILPAVWSLMLALRARGIGSAWTTLHLMFEADAARILNVPNTITQTALLPVAYFTGTDFKPAKRLPAQQLTHWERW
jgi:nitroreductase